MNYQKLNEEFRAYCLKHADPALVKKYSRYFREGYDAWGLSQQYLDDKVAEVCALPGFDLKSFLLTAHLYLQSGKYEETAFVLSVIKKSYKKTDREVFLMIADFFETGINNWAHADILGMMILPELMKRGFALQADFKDWLASPHKFKRRCVPVTFIKLLKTESSYQALFRFLKPLMKDPAREVHQGMGWFLREAWKLRPDETEAFLLQWKDTAPRLIFQYACEKMSTEEKAKFKRAKA